jgi:hypothetical protein
MGSRPVRGVYAVSDGASESYNSARWSRVLVSLFVNDQRVNTNWLRRAVALYGRSFDRNLMTWSAQAAFDRGSYATLTGIVLSPAKKQVTVLGIGDSVAILADGAELIASHPYTSAVQFMGHPMLLSTIWDRNTTFLTRLLVCFQYLLDPYPPQGAGHFSND